MEKKRVFVTGHLGYIGVHLTDLLKADGHHVTGCDINLFEGCACDEFTKADVELIKDTRHITKEDLAGHDCVMDLAAISNDPMGDVNPEITYSINRDASISTAELAKQAGVPRYLYSASCSVYGKGEKMDLSEDDPLMPLTAYAKSKIETEQAVSRLADENFTPAYLRNATAYGFSPMLRIDLVVNNLLASALSYGEIRIMSDGSPWRPLIHCRDIARAFVAFMNAPKDVIHNKAVNIGANAENFQVRDVGNYVQNILPDASIAYTGEVGSDSRDYRVKFDLLNALIPDFKLEYSLETGMQDLFSRMQKLGFNKDDFEGDQYVRLRTLKQRMALIT
ncbi:MAG: SDR family oxidoreductase [Pseudomonadota bacterium]